MPEAKHIENCGKDRGEIEILNGDRQSFIVVSCPDFARHTAAEHIIDNGSGRCGCLAVAHVWAPDARGVMTIRCCEPLCVWRMVAKT